MSAPSGLQLTVWGERGGGVRASWFFFVHTVWQIGSTGVAAVIGDARMRMLIGCDRDMTTFLLACHHYCELKRLWRTCRKVGRHDTLPYHVHVSHKCVFVSGCFCALPAYLHVCGCGNNVSGKKKKNITVQFWGVWGIQVCIEVHACKSAHMLVDDSICMKLVI